jgi:hypothetical protein
MLFFLVVMTAAQVSSVDARLQFGEAAATALELLMPRLQPGARVVWKDAAWLQAVGKPAQELFLPGFLQKPTPDGFVFATAIELSGRRISEIDSFFADFAAEDSFSGTQLAVFRSDARGLNVRYVSGVLDDGRRRTQCLDVQLVPESSSVEWPRLRVRYRAGYGEGSNVSVIEWTEVLDVASMRRFERLPLAITRHSAEGSLRTTVLRSRRVDGQNIQIVPLGGGTPMSYACGDPCIVAPDHILVHSW